MNELMEIVEILDGYTIEKVGYSLTEAKKEFNGWHLRGVSYIKETEGALLRTDKPDIADMMNRISFRGGKWKVSAMTFSEVPKGMVFDMLLRKVENEEEDGSDTEEHMEAEELS